MFGAYKRYPYRIPFRVKVFNVFRFLFVAPLLEYFLIKQLTKGKKWWKKLIPPVYFFSEGTLRIADRGQLRYQLDLSKLIDHSIYFFSDVDTTWNNLFRILKPDFRIIDAGANIGHLTLHFVRLCPHGFVYCFEPDQQNFAFLQENIRLNNFQQSTKLFKKALGEVHGQATLYRPIATNPGANRILSNEQTSQVPSEIVEVVTLDELFAQGIFEQIDLIKIDVEGFELFVLKGGIKLIQHWKPLLFIELAEVNLNQQHETPASLINFITSLGYKTWNARTLKPVDLSESNIHTDIICVPEPGDIKNFLMIH